MNTILRKQFLAHVGQTSPSPMLVEVERAEGSFFYTPEGRRYYDLVAGVSVSNVGHANREVVRAVQEQAARYMHVMVYGELVEAPQVRYAARIASLLPGGLESVYFVNSGAEAVEGALKLAKRFTGRTELISMRRAYHGSTHGSMSMMGAPEGEEWKGAFRPLLPDVQAIEFNDPAQLERITRRTACVLVEPVQGEAGVRVPRPGYLEALRRRCDEVGALLVFDEIQTGLGRTGELFAMQKYGVGACRWGPSSRATKSWTRCSRTPRWATSPPSAAIRSAVRRALRRWSICSTITSSSRSRRRGLSTRSCCRAIRPCAKSAAAACCWPSSWAPRSGCTASWSSSSRRAS